MTNKDIDNTSQLTPKIAPNVAPNLNAPFKDNSTYTAVMQNRAVNDIARLNSKRGTSDIAQQLIKSGDITAAISNEKTGRRFTPTQTMIFDYILSHHAANSSANSAIVSFTVSQYMTDRGLTDPKSARKQLDSALSTFTGTTLEYGGDKQKGPKHIDAFTSLNIVAMATRDRSQVVVEFTRPFNEIITAKGMLMPYPMAAFKIDMRHNPQAWGIVRKAIENKRINYGKPNADRIKISTLLKSLTDLPTYEEVRNTNRAYFTRIIEPVLRDLGETPQIQEIFAYAFEGPDGQPLSYDSFYNANLDYETFANSTLVITNWIGYPDTDVAGWKDTQQKSIEQAKKRRKKANPN